MASWETEAALVEDVRAALTSDHCARYASPEVLLPALVPAEVTAAVMATPCVPIFYDVRPARYAPEAHAVVPGITFQTAAVIVTRPFGAAPELEPIQAACAIHDVPCIVETPPPDLPWSVAETWWWEVYGHCSRFAGRLKLPENGGEGKWTAFPLLARTRAERDALVAAFSGAATLMPPIPCVTGDIEGAWGKLGSLCGAQEIGERGFVLHGRENWSVVDHLSAVLGPPAL